MRVLIFFLTIFSLYACENESGQNLLVEWDRDRNDMLNQEEFDSHWNDEAYMHDWDLNNDGVIDSGEWQQAYKKNYPEGTDGDRFGEFSDWDTNQDEFIDENELRRAVFIYWDADKDGNISKTEYAEYRYERQ